MRPKQEETIEIVNSYESGISMRQLAKQKHTSIATIKNILIENNIYLRNFGETMCLAHRNNVPISSRLLERIEGELLGDGSIRNYRHVSAFAFSSKHEEYAQWLSKFFVTNKIGLGSSGVRPVTWFDERIQKICTRFYFYTKGTDEFKVMGQKWYPSGIKVVPPDFHLSKISLLHWWLGDGTRDKHDGFGHLCTDAFKEHEVCLLSGLLNDLVAIKSTVKARKNPNGNRVFRVYIPRLYLDKMLSFLGPPPLACLAHRWGIQEVR